MSTWSVWGNAACLAHFLRLEAITVAKATAVAELLALVRLDVVVVSHDRCAATTNRLRQVTHL